MLLYVLIIIGAIIIGAILMQVFVVPNSKSSLESIIKMNNMMIDAYRLTVESNESSFSEKTEIKKALQTQIESTRNILLTQRFFGQDKKVKEHLENLKTIELELEKSSI